MKSSKLIMGCLATLSLTAIAASVQAEVDREGIAERLRPAGELCLQGEDCGTAAAPAADGDNGASADAGSIDGSAIYTQVCAMCHDAGVAGAPIHGDAESWSERVDKGWETLLDHSINGFNAMPARGGNPNLSDEEMFAATAYMLEPVMDDVPEAGGGEAAAEEPAAEESTAEEEAASEETASEETASEEPAADEAAAEEGSAEEEAATEDTAAEDAATEEEAATEDAATEEASEEAAADDAAAGGESAHASIDGEPIYNQACMACHMTGAAGAPILGDADQWGPRLEKGIDTLYDHAIDGFGAMPPKGGFANLSDDEVKASVDFMLEALE